MDLIAACIRVYSVCCLAGDLTLQFDMWQIEGVLSKAVDELRTLQEERRVYYVVYVFCSNPDMWTNPSSQWSSYCYFIFSYDILPLQKADPSIAEAIDAFLMKLNAFAKGEQAFTFVIDDPSGNSYIENPYACFYSCNSSNLHCWVLKAFLTKVRGTCVVYSWKVNQ